MATTQATDLDYSTLTPEYQANLHLIEYKMACFDLRHALRMHGHDRSLFARCTIDKAAQDVDIARAKLAAIGIDVELPTLPKKSEQPHKPHRNSKRKRRRGSRGSPAVS